MVTTATQSALLDYAYNQVFVYDATIEEPEYFAATDAMNINSLTVGAASGVVHILLPHPDYRTAPIKTTVYRCPPPLDNHADHIVEFELPLPSGRLRLEGGGACEPTDTAVAPGVYRARWSGFDYDVDEARGRERFALDLWPVEDVPQPPADIRRWRPANGDACA